MYWCLDFLKRGIIFYSTSRDVIFNPCVLVLMGEREIIHAVLTPNHP